LAEIVSNSKLQVRRKLEDGAVDKYLRRYKAGLPMPPIKVARVQGGALVLVDGWHRVAALKELGRATAEAEVIPMSLREARWAAARANLDHGVPLRRGEYRNVFKAYVHARQHIGKRGVFKSYRDIAGEIGGTRSYTTVRNWMLSDFPEIAKKMGGQDAPAAAEPGPLEPSHPEDDLLATGLEGAAHAVAAARGMRDPQRRGRLVEELRRALATAEQAGPYELSEDDF